MTDNENGDSGNGIDSELETEFERAREDEENRDTRNPKNMRAGAKATGQVRDLDELARDAQEAESAYGAVLERQNSRAQWFENLEERLQDNAGRENLQTVKFLADAQKTGQAQVEDEWEVNASSYLEEGGEPIEFAEEDQRLVDYFQTQSGAIDNLSETATQFTGLLSKVSNKEEAFVEEIEDELDQAEQEKEERIEDVESEYEQRLEAAEEDKQEEIGKLKDQVANQSTSDLESSSYEETDDLWEDEWSDISGGFKSTKEELEEERQQKVEEARSEYEERREELEERKEERVEDFQEQREELRDHKQQAVSKRADRLDELEEVQLEFSNDVIDYVEERAEAINEIAVTLGALENKREHYNNNSVEHDEELRGSLEQDQQGVSTEITAAANSMAKRALTEIGYLEDAVTDYAQASDAITDMLDEQEARVGTRLDEVVGLYDDLGLDVEDDEYGIKGLEERVKTHVENATETEYNALDEFRQEIESMARTP